MRNQQQFKNQSNRSPLDTVGSIIGLSLLIFFVVIAAAILWFGIVLIVGLLFILILGAVLSIKYKWFNNPVQPVKPPQSPAPVKSKLQPPPQGFAFTPPSPGYEKGYKAKTASRSPSSTTPSSRQEQPKQDHPRDYDQPQAHYPQQQ